MSNLRTPIGTQCSSCAYEFVPPPAPGESRRYWRGWVRVVDELGGTTVCALCALSLIAKCEKGAEVTVMVDQAQAHTARPEGDANKIDEGPLWVCDRCGELFRPDSSPNFILCWQCDESEAQR